MIIEKLSVAEIEKIKNYFGLQELSDKNIIETFNKNIRYNVSRIGFNTPIFSNNKIKTIGNYIIIGNDKINFSENNVVVIELSFFLSKYYIIIVQSKTRLKIYLISGKQIYHFTTNYKKESFIACILKEITNQEIVKFRDITKSLEIYTNYIFYPKLLSEIKRYIKLSR